jgi:hypothetical protein
MRRIGPPSPPPSTPQKWDAGKKKGFVRAQSDSAVAQCDGAGISDARVRLMEKHGIFHLMVHEEKAGFRGLLSVQDLLRLIVNDHKERADLLEAMMFP